jgi:DNA-binding transcriptional LysR family regulator
MAKQWSDRIGRRLKLRDLHIMLAVANSGSMGKAASDLAVSQPAISKAIADLEEALDVRLLDRSPQGIEPTNYGRALLKCGTAVFDDLRQGVKEIEFLADPSSGELSIGCSEPLSAGFVSVVINKLSRQYPKATFHVISADPAILGNRELPQRHIDLALIPISGLALEQDTTVDFLFDDRPRGSCRWKKQMDTATEYCVGGSDRRAVDLPAARHPGGIIHHGRISCGWAGASTCSRALVFSPAASTLAFDRSLFDNPAIIDGGS